MKNKLLLFVTFLALALITQASKCDKEKITTGKNNLPELSITLDQTAWFCAGECRYNFVFQEEQATTSRFDRPNDETPLWTCSRPLTSQKWNAILKVLDLDALADTEATIGCPGCADEPIETLTVNTGDQTYEVRMNMNAEVPSIQPLLDELRRQAESLKDRKNCQ